MMRSLGLLSFLACLAAAWAASAAEIVILESTAPGIEAGAIVEDTDTVEVPDGAMILIVEEDGSSREIAGPFSGAIGSAGSGGESGGGLIANLGKLVQDRESKRQVLGAIRAAPGQVSPQIYLVDVARSETVCIPTGQTPTLWRPATMAAETEVEMAGASGASARFLWPDEAQSAAWPDGLPLADGGAYALRLAIAPRPTEVKLRLVPDTVTETAARAAWMYQAGCHRQAIALIESLATD
ncbi:MAG: hypothetical protein ACMVY4_05405 [Minwuia sp.]|uniref:hypothetical protein n=1 Tax=Minwuia sp. TaxID=2493630 RepID=UPI003A8902BD